MIQFKKWSALALLLKIVHDESAERVDLLDKCDMAIRKAFDHDHDSSLKQCISRLMDLKIKYKKGIVQRHEACS